MQQHPVPQPITSYEFRLVGSMTLRQFAKLAVGAILALIVYGINPPFLLKWPLIILFGGIGALAAFFPFQGRPIDIWIMAFFKRIYSPTQYIWKKKQPNLPKVEPKTQIKTEPKVELKVDKPPKPQTTVFKAPPPQPQIDVPKVEAKFTSSLAIPIKPTIPNLLTGFVHDSNGKIIEGAILEIRDSGGIPVRAFKTNKLGQFQSATPLPAGNYEIITEKEGFKFDIIKIELKGEILSPIEIVSK